MECHECGVAVEPSQKFCTGCGASLAGVTDTTEVVPTAGPTAEPTGWGADDPVWAATAEHPIATTNTTDLPATEPITEVDMQPVVVPASDSDTTEIVDATPYDFTSDEPATTTEMPVTAVPVAGRPPAHRFRFSAVVFISIVTAILTLVASFAAVLTIAADSRIVRTSDTPVGFGIGTWLLDDLADNLSIAGLIAASLMVAGGVAAGFRWRWGSGLAGGAGLAFAGVAAIGIGLAQMPIDAAREFASIPSDPQITLTITRDLGYWLLVAAAAFGVVLFFASINDAITDRRSGLNPWIAALGALATVVAVVGPLIPEGLAAFSDNWYLTEGPGEPPAMLLAGRLIQLGLLAFTGVVGFLVVRRHGLGLAVGGSLPLVWMGASVLFELTDNPAGPGYRNPGASDIHLHGVTIIGLSALVAMSILAAISAYDQSVNERP